MTLLVTGGAGFIGVEIVQLAVARGERVRVLDSFRDDVHTGASLGAGTGSARALLEQLDIEIVRGDVRDPAVLDRALEGIDVVCHQAAKVGLGVDLQDAPDYTSSNVQGTAELLAAMDRRGIRSLVIASSMVVYGEGAYVNAAGERARPAARSEADLAAGVFEPRDDVTGEPLAPDFVSELDAVDPRNVYALTKLAQEHLAASWARSTGGRAAMLRYHNVYGPRMPRNTPYAGVAAIFRSALERGEAPRVFEDGGQRRDFVHVSDVARANLAAIDAVREPAVAAAADAPSHTDFRAAPDAAGANDPAGTFDHGDPAHPDGASVSPAELAAAAVPIAAGTARAFNVGSGTVTTVGEVAAALARVMNGPTPVTTGEYRLGDVRHITASSDRAAAELAWHAIVTVESGLREFAHA